MTNTIKNRRRIMIGKDIALGRFDLNVSELVILLGIMGKMSQTKELSEEEKGKWWKFSVEEYMELRGVSRAAAKEALHYASENLFKRELFTQVGEERPIKCHWIFEMKPIEDLKGGCYNDIELKWHPKALPFITELKQYCIHDLKKLGNLKHFLTYRLYFWLSQKMYNCRNGRLEISLEEFREQFGFTDSYMEYKDLKRNIIKPVLREILEKKLLFFGFREKKRGKWVVGLEFSWGLDRWEEERRED